MNKAAKVTKSSALTKHKWPLAAQFVWEVYNRQGRSQHQMARALGMKYFNFNKRASKLVKRCGGLVLAVIEKGDVIRYYKATKLTANEARAWVKKSKKGQQYND